MLGTMRKRAENKTTDILNLLQKSMVRLHLEYCVQLCLPCLKNDITELSEGLERGNQYDRGGGATPI